MTSGELAEVLRAEESRAAPQELPVAGHTHNGIRLKRLTRV